MSDGSAVTAAYKVGARLAQALPDACVEPASRVSARAFKLAMRGRRETVARHLRRVRGPSLEGEALDRAVDASFLSYTRYWVESFRVPTTSKADIAARFTTEGIHHMLDALADGRGAILALPHLGGWEWAGRWVADQGIPITVVVEPLDPPELFEWFVGYRRSLGMQVVPVGLGAAMASIKALRSNGVLCLLCDRDIGTGGVEVEFFGERTKLPAGPATLALRTGAPILPDRGVLRSRRTPRRECRRADRDRATGIAGRGHRGVDAGARVSTGRADPRRARAVASVPTELAERPRLLGLTCGKTSQPAGGRRWSRWSSLLEKDSAVGEACSKSSSDSRDDVLPEVIGGDKPPLAELVRRQCDRRQICRVQDAAVEDDAQGVTSHTADCPPVVDGEEPSRLAFQPELLAHLPSARVEW